MAEPADSPKLTDEATMRIEASPATVWAIVTDIAGMGRLSPECTGGKWLDGVSGPSVGVRFKVHNKHGHVRWSTTNTVVAADPEREFAFETKQSGIRWSYRLEADGDATIVTETRERFRSQPALARIFVKTVLGGVEEHEDELRAGMVATLERLKAVAEAA